MSVKINLPARMIGKQELADLIPSSTKVKTKSRVRNGKSSEVKGISRGTLKKEFILAMEAEYDRTKDREFLQMALHYDERKTISLRHAKIFLTHIGLEVA